MEKIFFTPEGEEPVQFCVLEQTRLGGVDYILVTDSEEGDGEAYALYEIVTDDEELNAVAAVFENMLDDVELS